MAAEDKTGIRDKAVKGIIWQLLTRGCSKIVTATVSIALARILCPEDFGIVAMTSIFLAIIGLITDGGLGASLVQKKDIDHLDTNTVFFFGLVLALVLYLILFFCAPLIARLYHTEALIPVLRVVGLGLFFSSTNNVQSSLISRDLAFKKVFYVSLISSSIGGAVGISLALSGQGYWALVIMSLVQTTVTIVTMSLIIRWRPKLEFSFCRLKELYSFGLNYMGASLIGTLFNELNGALVGAKYNASSLAYYNRGGGLPSMANNAISGSISSVLFPTLSKLQDDKEQVKSAFRRSLMLSTFFVAPIMVLISATAHNLVTILYTEKWLEAVPFLQVMAITTMISVLSMSNLHAINAIGRSDITLKLEIFKKPVCLAVMLYSVSISPFALAIGNLFYSVYATSINMIPNKKLLSYGYREQLHDIVPHFILAIIGGGLAFLVDKIHFNLYLKFIVQIIIGGGSYLVLARLFKLESINYAFYLIKEYKQRFLGKPNHSF